MSFAKENKKVKEDKKWWVVFAMSACLALVYLDQTGVALALENMQQSLGLSTQAVQWIINAYLLALAVFMLLGGRLADIVGHRKIFLLGMSIFLISSIFCATADIAWKLIISRAFQGLGGAMLIPTSIVLIANSTTANERGKMIGISISLGSIFLAFGPTIGGLLTQFWNWRLIFWINVPIGLISIFLTLVSVPKMGKKKYFISAIDWVGFSLFAISITSLVVAFMQANDWGWNSPSIVSLFISFFVFFSLFLLLDSRINSPFVNLKLFCNTTFLGGNAILFLLQSCHVSSAVFWVLYLQNVLGYSAGKAGFFILPVTLPVILCAQISGRLTDRYGSHVPIMIGMLMAVTGVFWVAFFSNYYNYPLLFTGFLLYGCGAPLVIPAVMTSILSSTSQNDHGMASGIANSMRQIGGALGLSIIGTIITNITNLRFSEFLYQAKTGLPLSDRAIDIPLNAAQLKHLLMSQNHVNDFPLGMSINDMYIIRHLFAKAYAQAFSFGMIIVAIFALIAFSIAVVMFKKNTPFMTNKIMAEEEITS